MSLLFNRAATFTFGQSLLLGKQVSGLRIAFEITKSSDSTPNPAKITIYNLSENSRAKLEEKNGVCVLEAGYKGDSMLPEKLSTIFKGDIIRVNTERHGPDILSIIEAGDSETALRQTHIEQSFSPFTSVTQVVAILAKKLGVAVGSITGFSADIFKGGLSLSGLVSDQLDLLTQKADLEWHVTDGELNILPKGQLGAIVEEIVTLDKDTGLIGIPSKSEKGVEFQSLLQPKIKPGGRVIVFSKSINGLFKVRRVSHEGDTHGGSWLTKVEA